MAWHRRRRLGLLILMIREARSLASRRTPNVNGFDYALEVQPDGPGAVGTVQLELGAPGAGVEVSMIEEGDEGMPCLDMRGPVTIGCWQFRLGNFLMLYWNARALAFFKGYRFSLKKAPEHVWVPLSLIMDLPVDVQPLPSNAPTALQKRTWSTLQSTRAMCLDCAFPGCAEYGVWRIFYRTIFKETKGLVQRRIDKANWTTKAMVDWKNRQDWAVYHFRCDPTIFKNEMYGFLPHRFLDERLPSYVRTVLILGQVSGFQGRCHEVLVEVVDHLRNGRHLQVLFQQAEVEQDWLTLATAPLVFCSPSTYCLTAVLGNPGRVYFPTNGLNMAVPEDGKLITNETAPLRPPGFKWVQSEYVPGPAAADLNRQMLLAYLRSKKCDQAHMKCVPINGSIPEVYQLHHRKTRG